MDHTNFDRANVTGANFLHAIFIEASFIDAIKDKALFSYAGIKIFEKKITDNNVIGSIFNMNGVI